MVNIAAILTLLLLPYWLLSFAHVPEALRGRVGVALVFAFTGVGHFIKTAAIAQMLPAWVPGRLPLVYLSGVFELLAAVAILFTPLSRHVGLGVVCFPALDSALQHLRRLAAGGFWRTRRRAGLPAGSHPAAAASDRLGVLVRGQAGSPRGLTMR